MAKKGQLGVIKEYFGYQPVTIPEGMTQDQFNKLSLEDFKTKFTYEQQVRMGGIKGFNAEWHRLTPEDKTALAQMAAVELGLAKDDVDFPLG